MTAIQALLGFAAWTLLLVLLVFAYRGGRFLAGTPIKRSNGEPDGAANGSQPTRSETDRTPSAAGSRR